jgi:hypothetical protein
MINTHVFSAEIILFERIDRWTRNPIWPALTGFRILIPNQTVEVHATSAAVIVAGCPHI